MVCCLGSDFHEGPAPSSWASYPGVGPFFIRATAVADDFEFPIFVTAIPATGQVKIELGPIDMSDVCDSLEHLGSEDFREDVLDVVAKALAGTGSDDLFSTTTLDVCSVGRFLVVVAGSQAGARIPLSGAEMSIGRQDDCTWVIDDQYASMRHAKLFAVPMGSGTSRIWGRRTGRTLVICRFVGRFVCRSVR